MKLWEVIEQSKGGYEYLEPSVQFSNLVDILKGLSVGDRNDIEKEFRVTLKTITMDDNFEKLHDSNGGIIDGGDDSFYMDFGSWLVGQGESVFNEFSLKGTSAVLQYIVKHNIPLDDCTFECMLYAFSDVNE